MAHQLKTYSLATFLPETDGHREVHGIVAAASKKEAARLLNSSVSFFREHAIETDRADMVAATMSEPVQVFWQPFPPYTDEWFRWENQEAHMSEKREAQKERASRKIVNAEQKTNSAEPHISTICLSI